MSYYSCSFGDLLKSSPVGLHNNNLGCGCNPPRPQSDNSRPYHVPPSIPTRHPHAESRKYSSPNSKTEFWETLLKKHEWRIHQMTLKKFELCDSIQELQLQVPAALLAQAHKTQDDLRKVVQQLTAASGDDLPSTCRTCKCGACPLSVPNNYPKNLFTFCYCKDSDLAEDVRLPKIPVQKKIKVPKKASDRCSICKSHLKEIDKLSAKERNTPLKVKRDVSPSFEEKPIAIINNFYDDKETRRSQIRKKTSFTKVKIDFPPNLEDTPISIINNSYGDKKTKTSEIWKKTSFIKVIKDSPPNLKDTPISVISSSYGDKKPKTKEIWKKTSFTKVIKDSPPDLKDTPLSSISSYFEEKQKRLEQEGKFQSVSISTHIHDTESCGCNTDTMDICDQQTIVDIEQPKLITPHKQDETNSKKQDIPQPICSCGVCAEEILKRIAALEKQANQFCIRTGNESRPPSIDATRQPIKLHTSRFRREDIHSICDCEKCTEQMYKRMADEEKYRTSKSTKDCKSVRSIGDHTEPTRDVFNVNAEAEPTSPLLTETKSVHSTCDSIECVEEVHKRLAELDRDKNAPKEDDRPVQLICNCKECTKVMYKRSPDLREGETTTLTENYRSVQPICNCIECTEGNLKLARILNLEANKISLPAISCKSVQATCECVKSTERMYKMSTELEENKICLPTKDCKSVQAVCFCPANTEEVHKTFMNPEENKTPDLYIEGIYKGYTELEENNIYLPTKDCKSVQVVCECVTNTEEVHKTLMKPEENKTRDLYTERIYTGYTDVEENKISLRTEDYKSAQVICEEQNKMFTEMARHRTVASVEDYTSIHPICNCTNCAKEVWKRIAELDEHGTCAFTENFKLIKPICGCIQCTEESSKRITEMTTRRSDFKNLEESNCKADNECAEELSVQKSSQREGQIVNIPAKCTNTSEMLRNIKSLDRTGVKMSDIISVETLENIQPICRCPECAENICKRIEQIQAQTRNTPEAKHSRAAQLTKSGMQKGDFVQPICNCNECVEQTYKRITELQEQHYEQSSKGVTELQEHPMHLFAAVCSSGSLAEETKMPSKRTDVGSVKVLDIPNLKKSDLQPSCDCRRSNEKINKSLVKLDRREMNFVPSDLRASFRQLCKSSPMKIDKVNDGVQSIASVQVSDLSSFIKSDVPGDFTGNADVLYKKTADVKVGISVVACRSRSVPSESITVLKESLTRTVNKSNLTSIRGPNTTTIKMSAISSLRKLDIPIWRGGESISGGNKIISAKFKGNIDMLYKIISEMRARITNMHGAVYSCKSAPLELTAVLKHSGTRDLNKSSINGVQLLNIFNRIKSDTQLICKDEGRRAEEGSKFLSEIEQLKRCLSMMTYSCAATASSEALSIKPLGTNIRCIGKQNNVTSEMKDMLKKHISTAICNYKPMSSNTGASLKHSKASSGKKMSVHSGQILNVENSRGEVVYKGRECVQGKYNTFSKSKIKRSDEANIGKSDTNSFKIWDTSTAKSSGKQPIFRDRGCGEERNNAVSDVRQLIRAQLSAVCNRRIVPSDRGESLKQPGFNGQKEPVVKMSVAQQSSMTSYKKLDLSSSIIVKKIDVAGTREQKKYVSNKVCGSDHITSKKETFLQKDEINDVKQTPHLKPICTSGETIQEKYNVNTKLKEQKDKSAVVSSYGDVAENSYGAGAERHKLQSNEEMYQRVVGDKDQITHEATGISELLEKETQFKRSDISSSLKSGVSSVYKSHEVIPKMVSSRTEQRAYLSKSSLSKKSLEKRAVFKQSDISSSNRSNVSRLQRSYEYFPCSCTQTDEDIPKTTTETRDPRTYVCSCSQTSSQIDKTVSQVEDQRTYTSACSCSPALSQKTPSFNQTDKTGFRRSHTSGRSDTQSTCTCNTEVSSQRGTSEKQLDGTASTCSCSQIESQKGLPFKQPDITSSKKSDISSNQIPFGLSTCICSDEEIHKAVTYGSECSCSRPSSQGSRKSNGSTIQRLHEQSVCTCSSEDLTKGVKQSEDDLTYVSVCSCGARSPQRYIPDEMSRGRSVCSCSLEGVHKIVEQPAHQQIHASICSCSRSSSQRETPHQRIDDRSVCTCSDSEDHKTVKQSEDQQSYISACTCSTSSSQREMGFQQRGGVSTIKIDTSSIQKSYGQSVCSCNAEEVHRVTKQPLDQRTNASVCSCSQTSAHRETDGIADRKSDTSSMNESHFLSTCTCSEEAIHKEVPELDGQKTDLSTCSCSQSSSHRETGFQRPDGTSDRKSDTSSMKESHLLSACTCSTETIHKAGPELDDQKTYQSTCSCSQSSSHRETGFQRLHGTSDRKSDTSSMKKSIVSTCTCSIETIHKAVPELDDQKTYLSTCSCSRASSQRGLSAKYTERTRTTESDVVSTQRSHEQSTCTCSVAEINKTVGDLDDEGSFLSTCSCGQESSQNMMSSKQADRTGTKTSDTSSTQRSRRTSSCTCSIEEMHKVVPEMIDQQTSVCTCSRTSSQRITSSKQSDGISTGKSDTTSNQKSQGRSVCTCSAVEIQKQLAELDDQQTYTCSCDETSSQRGKSSKQQNGTSARKSDAPVCSCSRGTSQRDVSPKQSDKSSASKSDTSSTQRSHKQSISTSSTEQQRTTSENVGSHRTGASECSCSRGSSQKGTSYTQPDETTDRKSDLSKTGRTGRQSISTSTTEEIQNAERGTSPKEQDESSSKKSGGSSVAKSIARSTCTCSSKEIHEIPAKIREPRTNVPGEFQPHNVAHFTSIVETCECEMCAEEVLNRIAELEEKGVYSSAPACVCESAIQNKMTDKDKAALENQMAQDKVPTSTPLYRNIVCDCTVCAEKVTEVIGVVADDEKPLDIDTYPICECEICKQALKSARKNLPQDTTTSEIVPICSCNDCKLGWPPVRDGDVKGEISPKMASEQATARTNGKMELSYDNTRECNCSSVPIEDAPDYVKNNADGGGDIPIKESDFQSVPESTQASVYQSVESICVCSSDPIESSYSCPVHSQSLIDESCSCKIDSSSIPILTPASCTCTLTDLCTTSKDRLSPATVNEIDSSCKCTETDSTISSTTTSKSASSQDTSVCNCSFSDSSSSSSDSAERLPGRISSFSICSCTPAPKGNKSEALEEYVKEIAFDDTTTRKRKSSQR